MFALIRSFSSKSRGKSKTDEAYWDGLAECYHEGLVANVGVCNYGPTMVHRAYEAGPEALQKRGVPVVIPSPSSPLWTTDIDTIVYLFTCTYSIYGT